MTANLFGAAAEAPKVRDPRDDRPTFFPYIEAARRKLGVGAAWEWAKLESVDKSGRSKDRSTIVTGGVPNHTAKRPWKGVPLARVLVTDAEIDAEIRYYEASTGKCSECSGYGERANGWSIDTGTRYETCSKCNGAGSSSRTER